MVFLQPSGVLKRGQKVLQVLVVVVVGEHDHGVFDLCRCERSTFSARSGCAGGWGERTARPQARARPLRSWLAGRGRPLAPISAHLEGGSGFLGGSVAGIPGSTERRRRVVGWKGCAKKKRAPSTHRIFDPTTFVQQDSLRSLTIPDSEPTCKKV